MSLAGGAGVEDGVSAGKSDDKVVEEVCHLVLGTSTHQLAKACGEDERLEHGQRGSCWTKILETDYGAPDLLSDANGELMSG